MRRFPPALMLLAFAFAAAPPRVCKAAKPTIVVVLKAGTSKGPLAPYEEAAKGFRAALQPAAEVLIAPDIVDKAIESIRSENPDLLVAFGTEAAQFAEANFPALPRVVALAPGVTPAGDVPAAVITPDISADLQVRWIHEALPDVSRVGVVYDPSASQSRVDEVAAAMKARPGRKLEVVPIPVSAESEVPGAFKKARGSIEALLFVPDRTVITRGTISYLLKETLASNIPVIGFNHYFVDNGAVLGFSLDYESVGRQAADAARTLPQTGQGWVAAPRKVTVWINRRVADKLRIRTAYDPDKVEEIR